MHPAIKLVVGLVFAIIGIIWYAEPILFGSRSIAFAFDLSSTFQAFVTVFAGIFGLVLIVFGLVIAWIEYEDLKWERKEKRAKKA